MRQCCAAYLAEQYSSNRSAEYPAVFGDHERVLKPGLETLLNVLNANRRGPGAELTRYCLSLMLLERKLFGHPQALRTLSERIGELDRQLAHFDLESDTIVSALAAIYVDVISPLGRGFRSPALPPYCKMPRYRRGCAPRCWQDPRRDPVATGRRQPAAADVLP